MPIARQPPEIDGDFADERAFGHGQDHSRTGAGVSY
jgi:hypothetical protein